MWESSPTARKVRVSLGFPHVLADEKSNRTRPVVCVCGLSKESVSSADGATSWEPRVQTHEPMGDALHSRHGTVGHHGPASPSARAAA